MRYQLKPPTAYSSSKQSLGFTAMRRSFSYREDYYDTYSRFIAFIQTIWSCSLFALIGDWSAEVVLTRRLSLKFPENAPHIYFLDCCQLISFDLAFYLIDFLPHLLDPSLDDEMRLATLIVELMNFFELSAKATVIVVILSRKLSQAIGFCFSLFDFLELTTKTFVDVIVGAVDGVLANGVNLIDGIENWWVFDYLLLLEGFSRSRLLLLHIWYL